MYRLRHSWHLAVFCVVLLALHLAVLLALHLAVSLALHLAVLLALHLAVLLVLHLAVLLALHLAVLLALYLAVLLALHLAVFCAVLLALQNLLHENASIVKLGSLAVKMFAIFCHTNEPRTLSARPVQISGCSPLPSPALTGRRTQNVLCAVRTKCPNGGRTVPWFVRVSHCCGRSPIPDHLSLLRSVKIGYGAHPTFYLTSKNSVALVRERTIPTERPPPVGEISANFCG